VWGAVTLGRGIPLARIDLGAAPRAVANRQSIASRKVPVCIQRHDIKAIGTSLSAYEIAHKDEPFFIDSALEQVTAGFAFPFKISSDVIVRQT
jgi:hypothetical protein